MNSSGVHNNSNRVSACKLHVAAMGFTLIELLIVVAIIAILASIALVNFQLASRRAQSARCKSNLKAIDYALKAYKIDYNHYPPADGIAGDEPSPGKTQYGNGPAGGGLWDGVSLLLVKLQYMQDARNLYCPVLAKKYAKRRQNFRYAYNNSASDTGGSTGGANNVERDASDIWICRCLWCWKRDSGVGYPHDEDQVEENVLFTNSRVEQRNGAKDYEEFLKQYSGL